MGTIDGFIWRVLVRPLLTPDKLWSRIESWDLNRGATSHGVPLEAFDFLRNGTSAEDAQLRPQRLNVTMRRRFETDSVRWGKAESQALRTHRWLTSKGFITGRELRWHAIANLTGKHGSALIEQVRERFAELIVDEAQDCSADDLEVFGLLAEGGLPMMLVGDLDQGIYGYRGADPQQVQQHVSGWQHLALTANWRSSPIITTLAATLRNSERAPDTAVGEHHDVALPVMLFEHDGSIGAATSQFLEEAAALGIDAGQCMILAHAGSGLPGEYTGSAEPPTIALAKAAWAVGVLRTPSVPRKRYLLAEETFHRIILHYWFDGDEVDDTTVEQFLRDRKLSPAAFKRTLLRVLRKTAALDLSPAEWRLSLLAAIESEPPCPGTEREKPNRSRMPDPGTSKTAYGLAGFPAPHGLERTTATFNVVHQVKGGAADAVMVVIPGKLRSGQTDRTVEAWITGEPSADPDVAEALRVLYVAVTRARRLIAFAVPHRWAERVAQRLRETGVPVEIRRHRVGQVDMQTELF
ncbi:UvrD-helicase domain-containing protein [Actinomadura madurae]|uniref:UvrD-helicase domain-containing protein n=1 Tax=Actinomadura madurae TaxID=1993 RepID=UPI000D8DF01A|nr:UvrD-helicase domain-containing protein [Actinomadura madurae]SPT51291.1 Putative ATP-dependent DNA helicase yjcD [Actinomadura madurae]